MRNSRPESTFTLVSHGPSLGLLLRMREAGRKVFLLTNSWYKYTNQVMRYLIPSETSADGAELTWKDSFDLIIVGASKPSFFTDGTPLREVDEETGALKMGAFAGSKYKGKVRVAWVARSRCATAGRCCSG